MSEIQKPEQIIPVELQQPPIFTDAEASAVLQAQADVAATRLDNEGNQVYREYIMGATYDGMIVSIDRPSGSRTVDDYYIVRVGNTHQLAKGTPLSEQKIADRAPTIIRLRDGSAGINSDFGLIAIPAPLGGELPVMEEKVLFPIGEDGKPFSPAAKREAEVVTARLETENEQPTPSVPQPEQISVGGIRRFLRRSK